MVHIIEELNAKKSSLLNSKPLIERLYYHFIRHETFEQETVNLSEMCIEESIAYRGYKNQPVESNEIDSILQKKPMKNFGFDSNVFNLIGIYLSAPNQLSEKLSQKFTNSNAQFKYLLYKVYPDFKEELIGWLEKQTDNIYTCLLRNILQLTPLPDSIKISSLFTDSFDITDLIILEDYFDKHFKSITTVNNLDSYDLIKQICNEFSNSIKKITSRRKNHPPFEFNDEYDVQDILYVMIKGALPKLDIEEVISKVGGNFTKIDLVLKDEGVCVETKMIKEKDKNESDFIKQIKEDIESYYKYPTITKLLFFVYDPFKKTTDNNNFYELNGSRSINNVNFEVEVIITN